nr:1-acyl-sn-glycerol-3-phosphate acyltransferase [Crinalium epipsammum]
MMQLSSEPTTQTSTSTKEGSVTSRVASWLKSIAYPVARYGILPFYFSRIEVTGQENLPTEGAVILAPTHRARWDAFVVPYATGPYVTGRDLRFMVSANEMKGLQGWFVRRLGGFPIDTEQPGIGSFRHGVELLLNKEMLVIFPEGNIFRDNQVHPLKRGLARIALQVESMQPGLGIKIVPISINYSHPFPKWRGTVKVNIASPLEAADYSSESARTNAKKLTADLETVIKQLETINN